ncbi:MAG: hypothetical protein J6V07_00895 [Clostridia bacterium]|nr:hypothetical protein [Clostridia bacterium]
MKAVRRVVLLLLILTLVSSSLVSCGESYKLRKSSDKEAETVLTLGEDAVPFEVLYAFFRNQCDRVGNIGADYFAGSEGEARFRDMMAAAERNIAEVYAFFAKCREVGIDPYGEEIEEELLEYLKRSVEGGTFGEYEVEGFESYDKYLEYVKEAFHMTDSVNRLMIRYALCEEKLAEYYRTQYQYTDEDVEAFFGSEDCIRVLWVVRNGYGLDTAENREQIVIARNYLLAGDHKLAIQHSTSPNSDFYMGRYTKDTAFYEELIEVAYDLREGEVSEILDLGAEGLFVVKRLAKDEADLESQFREITAVYLAEEMYSAVNEKAAALLAGVTYAEGYAALTALDFLAS